MTHSSPVTVYASRDDRGFADAIAAGISVGAHFAPQTADMSMLAHHPNDHGRPLVLVPPGGVEWLVKELAALKAAKIETA